MKGSFLPVLELMFKPANQDNTPINTNLPHTLDCIFLGPTSGKQPGYKFLNLTAGQVITCPEICELPITDLIIEAVEKLAKKDGINSMKFSRIDGLPFDDPTWIAGVDNDKNFDSDEDGSDCDDSDSDKDLDKEDDELIDDSNKGPDFKHNVVEDNDEDEERMKFRISITTLVNNNPLQPRRK